MKNTIHIDLDMHTFMPNSPKRDYILIGGEDYEGTDVIIQLDVKNFLEFITTENIELMKEYFKDYIEQV